MRRECKPHIIHLNNHSQEEADFNSIALLAHEDESRFHSLQQMAAKTIGVFEELILECAEGCLPE